jgi:diguanylate cyclase (GGDEF)-like protein
MLSDSLSRIRSAINEIAKATSEPEVYQYLTETLIKYFGFDRVTVRKADWEKDVLSLVCYHGFSEAVSNLELPLSEEAGAFGRAALKGEAIFIFEGEKVPSELRLLPEFARLKSMRSRFFAVAPIKVKGQVRVILGADRKTSGKGITPEDKEILDLFSDMVGTALENIITQEELNTVLIKDELTGTFNKRYFMDRLNEEFERAKRYDVPLSCCIFDIDDFKVVNDTHGHLFGDQVLKQVGNVTTAVVRKTDLVARYGGEEFTVLFTHTILGNAAIVVERIRRVISSLIFPNSGGHVRISATFGISSYPGLNVEKPEDLLYYADMALYEGKKQYNKNCVVISLENGYRCVRV